MDKDYVIKKYRTTVAVATGIYALCLSIASAVISVTDEGSFIDFGFGMYLLIFAVYSLPLYFTAINALTLIKEYTIYKMTGYRRRFRLCILSAILWELASLTLPTALHYSHLDKLIFPMASCAVLSVLVYVIGVNKKN